MIADALAWAETHPFDVAFLDIELHDMTGTEVARRLRKNAPYLPVIFCTGYTEYALEAMQLHADGYFKAHWQIVWLQSKEIHKKMIDIGYRIKKKYADEFNHIKAPYIKASLDAVPDHLKRIREYELQYTFHSDGWFLLHCIKTLLDSGKLKLPTEDQRKSISTMIFPKII